MNENWIDLIYQIVKIEVTIQFNLSSVVFVFHFLVVVPEFFNHDVI